MRRLICRLLMVVLGAAPVAAAGPVAVAIPCAGDAVGTSPAALVETDRAFRAVWRDLSPNWYTAYEARPPTRNVFDKSPPTEAGAEAVKGVVWAHGLFCIANVGPDGREVLVRYFARVAAFHEGQGWSRPFEMGLLQAYLARLTGETWRISLVAGERTILLPNTVKSQPALDALPVTDPASGLPCRIGTAWDGRRCVAVSAPASPKKKP